MNTVKSFQWIVDKVNRLAFWKSKNALKITVKPMFGLDNCVPNPVSGSRYAFQLFSGNRKQIIIPGGCVDVVPLGFSIELPEGYALKIDSLYSMMMEKYVSVMAVQSVVDCDYVCQVKILMRNHGKFPFTITPGMKIAIGTIVKVEKPDFIVQ